MSDLFSKLESLTPEQRKLLEARLARQGERDRQRRIVVPIQPDGDRAPFFCVHSAPGSVGYFGALASHLSPQQPFFGLRAAGLDGDETALDRVEEMATRYLAALRRARPEGPYLLGGHSFGGLVAFEMARRLAEDGEPPALLALLDTHLPGRDPTVDPMADSTEEAVRWERLGRSMSLIVGRDLGVRLEDLRQRSSREQLELVLDRVLAADAFRDQFARLPTDTRRTVLRRILEVADGCFRASERFRPQPYPGRITLFVVEERWSDGDGTRFGPQDQWAPFARGGIDLQRVPGDHASLMSEPHVAELAASLESVLERFA